MDPSIRTHDPVFEALLTIGTIAVVVAIVCTIVIVHILNKDRRY